MACVYESCYGNRCRYYVLMYKWVSVQMLYIHGYVGIQACEYVFLPSVCTNGVCFVAKPREQKPHEAAVYSVFCSLPLRFLFSCKKEM